MCFKRQWLALQSPGSVLLERFHHKATIVSHKRAVISQSSPTTTKIQHPFQTPLNPLEYLHVLLGLFGFVLFCVLTEVWEINDVEFGCGTLLVLLSDFDVVNMCGLGSMADERTGVWWVFVRGVCGVCRPAGSFFSLGSTSVSGASGFAKGWVEQNLQHSFIIHAGAALLCSTDKQQQLLSETFQQAGNQGHR